MGDTTMLLLSTVSLVLAVIAAAEETCKDNVSLCPKLIRYCNNERYGKWMHEHCERSCHFCIAKPTEPSPPPPPPPTTEPVLKKIIPGFCGSPQVQGVRVIGGVNAVRGSWPWQILLLFSHYPSCGGSLISPYWVVTAAHCVYGYEDYPQEFTVRTGEHNRDKIEGSETEYVVEKIITHAGYDPNQLNNDIALIKLLRPVLLNKYVQPVCLPDAPPDLNDDCYITGWGKMRSDGRMTNILQQGKLPVVSRETCHNLNNENIEIPVTEAMICGGNAGKSTLSGCHGDSGGPFVCEKNGKWYLQGAVSHGSGTCNSTETYTVFAKVSYFRNWIDETMLNE